MLQKRQPSAPPLVTAGWADAQAGTNLAESLERLAGAVFRQWRILFASVLVAMVIGAAYVITAVPLYTSSITILTNQSTTKLVNELSDSQSISSDDGGLESQVQLVKSEKVGLRVVDTLELGADRVFLAGVPSFMERLQTLSHGLFSFQTWFSSSEEAEAPSEALRRAALFVLRSNLAVERVGRTFALQISFTSPNPEKAASIAHAYGEAYIADQLDTMFDATRTAGDWLQQRIEELRRLALESDAAVQKFRSDNGLISAQGVLVTDQNLAEINARLVQAQEDTSKAQARYDRIQDILNSGSTDALVSDALDSALINQLREKYLSAAKRESEIVEQLGPEHISAVRFRAEMDEYRRQIVDELRRIAESYQSDVQVARSKEESIRASVAGATEESIASSEIMVHLRELERQSDTYRSLYEKFLERYQEAVQQESFPITEARIINDAKVPVSPSSPQVPLALGLSAVIGLLVGSGLAAFREYRDRYFRVGDQVRSELGLPFIGASPLIVGGGEALPAAARPPHPRHLHKTNAASNYVVDNPHSQMAETLRSAQFYADLALADRKPKVIGIVSVLPSEGKSTTSINFAELLASQGTRTLLIDADLRRPGLTSSVARHAGVGLLEAILDRKPLKDLVLVNPNTRLAVVPAVVKQRVTHSSELLASDGMDELLARAGESFDYIVVDLPPLLPVVDARAIASRIDAFVLVVAWGQTSRRVVRSALEAEPQIAEKCIGVILNKVDQEKMKYYWSHGSSEYYYSRYSSYHGGAGKPA